VSARDLRELREILGDCHRCPLGDTRITLVFGTGDANARVLFVGEAPGRNEDLNGEPFVGAAGRLLDELLVSIGLSRSDIYIANVLKCRPPKNRDPKRPEIESCTPFLHEQIRIIDPTVVVTLGNFATRLLLDTKVGITDLHGAPVVIDGRTVLPVFHPAATIYDRTKRDDLFADFATLGTLLTGGRT